MKMWRKLAMVEGKKDGKRPGRQIKQMFAMQEYLFKQQPRMNPLLESMFKRAGLPTPQPMQLPNAEGKE